MKGSDNIKITINISGELIKLDVKFDEQNNVRDAEKAVNSYLEKLKKAWPDFSERKLLAMTAYKFAKSYHNLLKIQEEALQITGLKCQQIDNSLSDSTELDD